MCLAFAVGELRGQDRYVYVGVALHEAIADIEARGAYRFLYRDALISGKTITIDASTDNLVASLEDALKLQRVEVTYDAAHRQILLSTASSAQQARSVVLAGYVLDRQSGARLPFANVTWKHDGYLQGVTTNESGFFQAELEHVEEEQLILSVSYIGYQPERVLIALSNLPAELSIRLEPAPIQSREVLVTSSILNTDVDTTWYHLLNPGLFSPLGESSIIRSLNALPAISLSTALSDGLNVRGSKADGFQVLLDGAPIYNQNHFFGLFDAFNADALQTVGFYYDIAPASYFAPPGGTISLITRTGSINRIHSALAASSTSLRGTLEGPLVSGSSSWLISGRFSYLNNVNWFNNKEIIGIGLETELEFSDLGQTQTPVDDLIIRPVSAEAKFYDIHGKLSAETRKGMRSSVSFYIGGNDTELVANRLTIGRNVNTNRREVTDSLTTTSNEWGNEAVSFQLHHRVGTRAYGQSTLAASHYLTRYTKDDFVYSRLVPRTGNIRNYVFPFTHENELVDLKWTSHLALVPSEHTTWTLGGTVNYYALNYTEQSALRPSFGEDYYAIESDIYGEYERRGNLAEIRIGARGLYYTQGPVVRLSPRLQLTMLPKARASFRIGYSRNYQFLHQLYLENTNSASIWILTTGALGPSSVNNYTAGLYLKLTPTSFFQVEGYYREQDKLRQHEINAPTQLTTQNETRFVPWFSENNLYARGLEFMHRQRFGNFLWTNSYTLSNTELQNDTVYDGARYPAEWDRRHQLSSHAQLTITRSLSAQLTWFYATGNPDVIQFTTDEVPTERLPDYQRLDASLRYNQQFGSTLMKITLSAYNLLDVQNTWYRERIQVFNPNRPAQGTTYLQVDVFDLGFQPSFDIAVQF